MFSYLSTTSNFCIKQPFTIFAMCLAKQNLQYKFIIKCKIVCLSMCCICIYFTYSFITHSSSGNFFQWQSQILSMVFNNFKSELILPFVVCQSQIEISGQLNYALRTVIGKIRCNNFLFSSFVTVTTISCFGFYRKNESNSLFNLSAQWMDSLAALLRNLTKFSFESIQQFLDQLSFDQFFSICSNIRTTSFSLNSENLIWE